MKPIFLTIFTFLIVSSCRQSAPLTENEKTNIIAEVRLTLGNYYGDIRKSGLTAEFKYLDNSPDFFWVPPGFSSPLSYDSVVAVIKKNAPNYKSVDNSFDSLKIIPLTKEIATYTGRLKSTMMDTSGKVATFSLIESGVLIRRTDGWKLLSGQTAVLNQ